MNYSGGLGIDINIQPDKGNDVTFALSQFYMYYNKTAFVNDTFTVVVDGKNLTDDIAFQGKLGVALLDNSGKIVEIIGTKGLSVARSQTFFHNNFGNEVSIPCKVPAAGKYRLGLVNKSNDLDKWTPITITFNNTPTTLDFTVAAPLVSTFTDSRDGKVYKKTTIGTQIWMAENLNYVAEGSVCYENQESNCKIYGRLYNKEAANAACPKGWHLPSNNEWETLLKFVRGNGWNTLQGDVAGEKLKATSGWDNNNGVDAVGFAALPGGLYSDGRFTDVGKYGYWWKEGSSYVRMSSRDSDVDLIYSSNNTRFYSIRCLED